VLGKPFLDWLLVYLRASGFRRALIAAGYRADEFRAYNGSGHVPGLELRTITEPHPLGTAGAFCHALEKAGLGDNLIVLNGDTLVLTALEPMLRDFLRDSAQASIVAVAVPDAQRYGTLEVDVDGTVRGFREKQPGAGLVNAGIYFFGRDLVAEFPKQRPLSFELDVFPYLLAAGHIIRSYRCAAPFLDIGVPDDLAAAPGFVQAHFDQFIRQVQS
jgi:NDP-sugar pyrophosphorylase family protein